MLTGIIGRKIGMTQLFSPDGTVTPAKKHHRHHKHVAKTSTSADVTPAAATTAPQAPASAKTGGKGS